MLDHIGFPVTDFARSKEFYARALEPLGFRVVKEVKLSDDGKDGYAGFGSRPAAFLDRDGKAAARAAACGIRRQKPGRCPGIL